MGIFFSAKGAHGCFDLKFVKNLKDASELETKYSTSLEILADWMSRGIAAAVYTQTSDVECEVNGLLSYDRKIQKLNATFLAKVHDKFWRTEAAQRTSERGSGGYLPASCKKACDKQGGCRRGNHVLVDVSSSNAARL